MLKNLKKNLKTKYQSDQPKVNHREAVKGHKTRKHFLHEIKEQEANDEIRQTKFI